MVFYFSGVGNSKYVAEKIAKGTGDKTKNIEDFLIDGLLDESKIWSIPTNIDCLGLVTPVYYLGLPKIVANFLKKLRISKTNYCYLVLTYGSFSGGAEFVVRKLLNNIGLNLNSAFSIKMVDTYTPIFNVKNKEKNTRTERLAERQVDDVISMLTNNMYGDFVHDKIFPLFSRIYHTKKRPTRKFYTEDSCIGCKKCINACPDKAIEWKNHSVVWVKEDCQMCLRCLHKCPVNAIQYDSHTKGHGQYDAPILS